MFLCKIQLRHLMSSERLHKTHDPKHANGHNSNNTNSNLNFLPFLLLFQLMIFAFAVFNNFILKLIYVVIQ